MCSLKKLLNDVIYQEMGDSGKGGFKAAEGGDRNPRRQCRRTSTYNCA